MEFSDIVIPKDNTKSISESRNCILDQQTYLLQFDTTTNGHIHDQNWARTNMEKFHKSVRFKITLRVVCCEAWPLPLNSRKQKLKTFTHSRCTRDKGNVKSSQLKTTLIKHNPVYRDVKIDYNCLAAFPLEGIPNDLTNIDCNADSAIDTHLDEDRGPLDIKEIP